MRRPRFETLRAGLKALWSDDHIVARIVLVFSLIQLTAIFWDLPGSWGWENDGVAPRDLFGGLAFNLTPGSGHRYPLLHYLILGVLCLPILIPAVLLADSWSGDAIMASVLSVPVMTAIALVAKVVAVGMMAIALLALARIARRTMSRGAARWAALFAATCLSVAYYGRVSNLDGPYLMWTALAVDRLVSIAERGEWRDYKLLAVFMAAAVATKDQAYAAFVPLLPLAIWRVPRTLRAVGQGARHWRLVGRSALWGLVSYGLMSGALLNPTGFVRRLGTLTGGASQDWRTYERGWAGTARNLQDIGANLADYWWPWPLIGAVAAGVVVVMARPSRGGVRTRAWRLVPLAAGVGNLVFFTLVVARTEHRFVLPLGFFLAYYGGAAADAALGVAKRWRLAHVAVSAALVGGIVWGALHALQVHVTQWGDARREVVRWLGEQPEGTVVETYGLVVYQPHFDLSRSAPYRVQRVTDRPVDRRNPMPGTLELPTPFADVQARAPDVLVVTEGYASRFLKLESGDGRAIAGMGARHQADGDATRFFRAALSDELDGYALAFVARPDLPGWAEAIGLEPVEVHGSTGRRVWVLVRE